MPKFMTYQRPSPVKTGNWGGNKPTERTDFVRLPDVLKRS